MTAGMFKVCAGVIGLACTLTSGLSAQSAECKINDGSPYQVNGAKQYVLQAANSRYPDQVPKLLQSAVRVLTDDPEKIDNEAGRQFVLLRAYAQWMQKQNASIVMRRGDLGFTKNPDGTQNMLLAIDSAATAVEKLMPQCQETVAPYRSRFLAEILNNSITSLNADKNDSAAYYARTALLVSRNDPRPWNVLVAVYQKKDQPDSAMMAMQKVVELAGSDTSHAKLLQQTRYNLAVLNIQEAAAKEGAEQTELVAKARVLLEAYLKDSPDDASAKQALARTLRMSGDTTAAVALFTEMVKTPDKFTDIQLFEAASSAASSGQDSNAVTLFEAGLKKNPYHRTALLNLSNVLFQLKDTDRMGPAIRRAMELDPNYDTGWRLYAGYWQLRARQETDAAKKKMWNDSTLFYLDKQSKTNPRIDVNLAAKNGNAFEIQGTLVNEGPASASFTIKFELLDAAGGVVATKDVAVGPVESKANATFSVKVDAPAAVGYRYQPVK